ncbi:MAG: MBL fold metallo-hydrolase [Ruminiclostridium sp.]|nr:MBL fold metallo-hydrolase [Ruminiclostridium sp.]MBQ8801139.1 MBL fold metallo-hydrolase [Clostridium sp.]
MKLKALQVGPIGTNCYLLIDETTNKAAIVDPGDEANRILTTFPLRDLEVEYIFLTHGHYDHTTAVPELHEALPKAKVYIHKEDANGAGTHLFPLAGQISDLHYYGEGDKLPLGNLTVKVLHTPGHSPGSVVLQVEDVLFCGDTLFAGSCGRCDLRGGSFPQMLQSLKRLYELPGNYHVLPGHDTLSTLDREREGNIYMMQAMTQGMEQ